MRLNSFDFMEVSIFNTFDFVFVSKIMSFDLVRNLDGEKISECLSYLEEIAISHCGNEAGAGCSMSSCDVSTFFFTPNCYR